MPTFHLRKVKKKEKSIQNHLRLAVDKEEVYEDTQKASKRKPKCNNSRD
jgi:hypothetical protein